MSFLLHLAAMIAMISFVWAALYISARRVPRAGQIEFALWLLASDRAAHWWKIHPTVTGALTNGGRPTTVRLAGTAIVAVAATATSMTMWACASWPEFYAWQRLLAEWPGANAALVWIPALFVLGAIYLVSHKSDRIATKMAACNDPRAVAVWVAIDLATSAVAALLGWVGFLASLIASGREQELSHLWTRATVEMGAGWHTGLSLAADRNGWPSWGVWFYAIAIATMLPWLHLLGAVVLRSSVTRLRPVVERIDALGLINLEHRPLAAIAIFAALAAGASHALVAIVS